VRDGSTVVVVGDGAVGLCGVLAAARLGAARIVALSRHPDRRRRARAFGATDLVDERGKEAVSGVRELLGGTGADAVLECVGTEESLSSALGIVRDGGRVGYVGMPHAAPIDLARLFRRNVTIGGGMAPARIYIPGLLDDVLERRIRPGAVLTDAFDLADVQRAYEGMDRREIVKAMLSP
jgi:threonine dehydrogenase-like Zn-dependent dehydrogenase